MNKNIQIGNKVKAIRELKGLTQTQLADIVGISQRDVSFIEKGDRETVSTDFIQYLNKEQIDLNWFFAKDNDVNVRLLPTIPVENTQENAAKVDLNSLPNRLPKSYYKQPKTQSLAQEPNEGYQVATKNSRNKLYIVNEDVQAGLLVGFSDKNVDYSHPITIPWLEKGIFYLFNVRGDSMYPTLSNGDKVIAKQLNHIQDITNGEVCVLITRNGLLVKRLNKSKLKDGFITIISDNEDLYPEEDISTKIIMGVFQVVEASTSNLGRNNKDRELLKVYKQLLKSKGLDL